MTGAGWLLLCVSWGVLGSLVAYCLVRTLRVAGLREDGDADAPPGVAGGEPSD